jgi:pimeloyl-ACP methyl ester carboxylesterase
MNTQFATSADGTKIAFDRSGTGPAIVMLHGGGGRRQDWLEAGYVRRLRHSFTAITMDLRGHCQSGLPAHPSDYTTEKMGQDILAVADACDAERLAIWGMSFGGKVGRYLAVESERIVKLSLMGTPMGLGVSGRRRQEAIDFRAHWPPIMQALNAGALDRASLPSQDQEFLQHFNVPVMLAWVRAMLDWLAVDPADFLCPTLWLAGSEDRHAMASIKEYERLLKGTKVQVQIIEGLDLEQLFVQIDRVFPIMLAFTQ